MRVVFILLSLIHLPFLLQYAEYYERFYGELPFSFEGFNTILFLLGAVVIGWVASKVPVILFLAVNGVIVLTSIGLAEWLFLDEHAYWFKPVTPTMSTLIFTLMYIALQGIARWGFTVSTHFRKTGELK
ncbi:hypothetical protein [Alteribacter aurantiacus]|uniref:hypothetical protein n=1 Tax=Alteribacter aurantiacus TaxID=254410 RepID=UPI0004266243|nr:hypothetical protein [Alteribacter aurantiacus]